MTDDEMLNTIAAVCDFNRTEVDKWRREALIIGRAVERATLEQAAQACEAHEAKMSVAMEAADAIDGGYLNACDDCADLIRALADAQSKDTEGA
ncbi:hypothetical protein [Caballeronia sp. LZ035]|uniref:hypothetical protein n=1 Tax=Caballeronia sp. LZ035 TaxID=3038568 RepID=UPI002864D0D2|nr:hypothetical protein [Caballeronia sp. LZ035]MDR5756977.1 hypothetical protein [Caballeronia sp. LZ035]